MTMFSSFCGKKYINFYLVTLIAMIFFGVGCGSDDKVTIKSDLPQNVELVDYFPLSDNRYLQYDWENNRGDAWKGSITVVTSKKDMGLNVFIIIDSTESYGSYDIFRSAYLWDSEGLKHLYRANLNGDSIAFSPPRLVLPAKMSGGKSYRREYGLVVYNAIGKKRYEMNVRQNQKLIRQQSITVGEKLWNDCIAIETEWTNTNSDGSKQSHRKVIWHAKGTGPVKIITDIPLKSATLKGEATGELVSFK